MQAKKNDSIQIGRLNVPGGDVILTIKGMEVSVG